MPEHPSPILFLNTRSTEPRASLVDDDGLRTVNSRGWRELAAGVLFCLEVALTGAAMLALFALAVWGEILVAWLGGAR